MMLEGIVLDPGQHPLNSVNVFYVDEFGNQLFDPVGTFTRPLQGVYPAGYFLLEFMPFGRLAFSHIGFETKFVELGSEPDFLTVEMSYTSYELPPVDIPGYPDQPKKMPWLLLAVAAVAFLMED